MRNAADSSTRAAIVGALDAITPPVEQDGRAVVRAVGHRERCSVGLDGRGWATLLTPAASPRAASVSLANLEFAPCASLLLCDERGGSERTVKARLSCRIDTRTARLAFCTAAAALVEELDRDPGVDIPARIAGFVELFRGLARQPPDANVVGLWGELALIAYSDRPEVLAQAWHVDPADVVDFEYEGMRLEVKTTRDPARTHWFSRDQLAISSLAGVSVCSLVAVASKSGQTVGDLLDRAAQRLSRWPNLAEHVVAVASRYVGEAVETSDLRFEHRPTLRSLRVIAFQDVPAVDVHDDRVLEVSWRAALENVPVLRSEELRRSKLLAALPAIP